MDSETFTNLCFIIVIFVYKEIGVIDLLCFFMDCGPPSLVS